MGMMAEKQSSDPKCMLWAFVVTSLLFVRNIAGAHLSYKFESQEHAQQGYGQTGCHVVAITLLGSCCS